jgi:signal transduction histidine kinase
VTFRSRILLACVLGALLPLVVFGLGARWEVRRGFEKLFGPRVEATGAAIRAALKQRSDAAVNQLQALARQLGNDPALRAALLQNVDRQAIIDYASGVLPTTGMRYLLLVDSAGTVLSSGHFQNDFDRPMSGLSALLAADGPVLVRARRPDGSFLALVRAHSFAIGDRSLVLAGGVELDQAFVAELAQGSDSTVVVALSYPGGALMSNRDSAEALPTNAYATPVEESLPFIDDAGGDSGSGEAQWTIRYPLGLLRERQRLLDFWLLAAIGAAILSALLISRVLAARVNKPLEELAEQTNRIQLDRIDVGFATDRPDEIGSLSRVLDRMVKRLRTSAGELREAEHRATVGDMARQVNHDIKNGLLPIRNVVRHLTDVARESPAELATVLAERESTLQGGLTYLESLAANYARLSPKSDAQLCDVNAIIRSALRDAASGAGARVELDLSNAQPRVHADPVALRRIVENLTVNALESLSNGAGRVVVSTTLNGNAAERSVGIAVADTGAGIERAVLDRIFDDFYTTKQSGSGLGLSIVRRLVTDMGGRIQVESEPGRGTTFHIELPSGS